MAISIGDKAVIYDTPAGPLLKKSTPPSVGDKAVVIPGPGRTALIRNTAVTTDNKPIMVQTPGRPTLINSGYSMSALMVGIRNTSGDTYYSTDAGATWTYRSTTLPETAAFVYAGSGVAYAWTLQNGIWRSTDGGATWAAWLDVGYYPYASCFNCMVKMSDGNLFLIGRSSSTGSTYLIVVNTSTKALSIVGASPYTTGTDAYLQLIYTKNNTLLVVISATNQVGTLYRSTNNGASWSTITSIDFSFWPQGQSGSLCDCGGGTILWEGAKVSAPAANAPMYRSTDDGLTWARIADRQGFDYPYQGNVFSPSLGVVIIMYGGIWRSTDYGDTWTSVTSSPFPGLTDDCCAFAYQENTAIFYLYIKGPSDPSIGFSTDIGVTWQVVTSPPIPGGGWCILSMKD